MYTHPKENNHLFTFSVTIIVSRSGRLCTHVQRKVIITMSLSRQFHWINYNLYQLLQHMWPDATHARMSAPRAERTR